MATFRRGLSKQCKVAIEALAREKSSNWWKDVLASKDLLLAVRGGYLNAYARGQSIFKIGSERGTGVVGGKPSVAIHFKYLIKPDLERSSSYIPFDGESFSVEPAKVVRTRYTPETTLPALIKTAKRFATAEKTGVHRIVAKESRVVDLEIAFTSSGEAGEKSTAPRMDVAVLVPWGSGSARLVFCEAKCADNKELSQLSQDADTGERSIAVVRQISRYEKFIQEPRNAAPLIDAYICVCRTLLDLRNQGWARKLDPLVDGVATRHISLTIHPHVYLLVYDFDADQKKGTLKRRLDALAADDMLGQRLIAKGDPDSFKLANDILRREGRV